MASEKSLVLDSDGYVLNGKIDCVLSDKNQNTVIVDFKKRQLPDRDICIQDELEDFQLPVYTILAESNKFAAVSTALFMRIIDPEKKVIVLGSVKSNRTGRASPAQDSIIQRSCDQGEKILLSVSEYAKKFISEVEAGDCSTIAADLSKCFGCDFRTVCRRTYDVSGGFYDRKWD
jgi:hypothetical protein